MNPLQSSVINQSTNALLRKPKEMRLYDALRIGYIRDEAKQAKVAKKFGYVLDKDLSDAQNQQVFYNPMNQKLLVNINGTNPRSLADLTTDVYLGAGHLKDTSRYKNAKKTLDLAKTKYNEKSTVITGDSLGGTIANYIATGKDTKGFALNSGYTIGQKTHSRQGNMKNFRLKGDIVSSLAPSKGMRTIDKGTWGLASHDINLIKDQKIYI